MHGHLLPCGGKKTRQAIVAFAGKYQLPSDLGMSLQLERHLDCVIKVGATHLSISQ